ncbi:CoxG family protein [Rhodoferax sp. UBA5149]|uniref:CoxG family protein n=1 Tax=Rhodoferax sp. UBA5149 TaxID=1947379 RepID=UPI0025D76329|nr:carbon monoxide dehydrogenase subunit G [Rhodoferax sp. UBA5149]
MELTGEQIVRAPRQQVWDALNDPTILSRCIPGCEEVKKVSDSETHTRVAIKIGPVRARFSGKIFMTDVAIPSRCTLTFEGSGGAAGFAKGRSAVTLTDEGAGTKLSYSVEASVGGKLGQIGGRLIDSSAKKMADEFFAAFDSALTGGGVAEAGAVAAQPMASYPISAGPGMPGSKQPFAGGGFQHELYRAFWFSFGAAFALLVSRWLH